VHEPTASLYRELLALRPTLHGEAQVCFDEQRRWLRVQRRGGEILCNFAAEPVQLPIEEGRHVVLSTHADSSVKDDPPAVLLAPLAGMVVR
jgi:hypothetical protein